MNWIQCLVYGIVSGISAFLPVSSSGHQVLLRQLFGLSGRDPLTDILVHLALLSAVLICCRGNVKQFTREFGMNRHRRRAGRGRTERRRSYDTQLLITAAIAMLIPMLFHSFSALAEGKLLFVCLFFILNGTFMYFTEHLQHSNKDASHMTGFDAILLGLFSGLSIFPGISRIGAGMSFAVGRGADKSRALNWVLLLSVPAFIILAIFDLTAMFDASQFSISFAAVMASVLSAVSAFIVGYATIMFMRFLIVNSGFTGFACYSWGMAVLTFILYLIS